MSVIYCYLDERHPDFLHAKRYKKPDPYSLIVKMELFVLSIVVLLCASTFYPMFSNAQSVELTAVTPLPSVSNEQVLGATTQIAPSPSLPTPSPDPGGRDPVPPTSSRSVGTTPTPTPPSPISTGKSHSKNSYTIAVFGDSMVDTMGERLEYLEHSLKAAYPGVDFHLYNYGVGSQNVEEGLARWESPLEYKDRHYPPIVSIHPDIIILGSFAYNPFTPYNRDRHWLGLTHLVQEAKKITPSVYIMAEIAPLRNNFGKGPNGVNWDTQTAYNHSGEIIEQLENAVGLSKSLNVPLIDVFDQSKGHPEYTNPSDGIHPSVSGHEFTANVITNTIQLR